MLTSSVESSSGAATVHGISTCILCGLWRPAHPRGEQALCCSESRCSQNLWNPDRALWRQPQSKHRFASLNKMLGLPSRRAGFLP